MKVPVNIRMPVEMKNALDDIASKEFRSLNSVILQLINEKLMDRKIYWQNDTRDQSASGLK
jgi:hypothetical protein